MTTDQQADIIFSCMTASNQKPSHDYSKENIVTAFTEQGQQKVFITKPNDNGDGYILQFRDYIVFRIKSHSIIAYIHYLPDQMMLDTLLFGPVIALWRLSQGHLGLHAASVAIDDRAVLFSAYNHSGKSSLAASCLQVGHALLADGHTAISFVDGTYFVEPSYPQMRMWEDQAAYFIRNYASLELVRENYPKRLAPIGPHGFGHFSREAKRLSVIYVPQQRKPDDLKRDIVIEPLSNTAAANILMGCGVLTNTRRWLPLHKHNLDLISDLVTHIPVRIVTYPSGYDILPSVRNTLIEDYTKLHNS